ncbi:MAG: hypothetical protein M1824_005511 [Vezdaea acicularis]|nr:MAG: hypothetical protein M1824_005511 [Vezdaea acicularis]
MDDDDSETAPKSLDGAEDSESDRSFNGLSTRSLVGSVLEYPIENGRRYTSTSEGAYFMPNDEPEQTRLNILHHLYSSLLSMNESSSPIGMFTLAPITPDPTRILDLGTGTGDWAIDVAEHLPSCEVVGADLAAIQPTAVPANVYFEVDDFEAQDWTFGGAAFDLVHARDVAGSFERWEEIYRKMHKALKPGGWVEIVELGEVPRPRGLPEDVVGNVEPRGALDAQSDTEYASAWDELEAGKRQYRMSAARPSDLRHIAPPFGMLERAGFDNIQRTILQVPVGDWPDDPAQKALGKMWLVAVLEGIEATVLRPLTRIGWPKERVDRVVERAKREVAGGFAGLSTEV